MNTHVVFLALLTHYLQKFFLCNIISWASSKMLTSTEKDAHTIAVNNHIYLTKSSITQVGPHYLWRIYSLTPCRYRKPWIIKSAVIIPLSLLEATRAGLRRDFWSPQKSHTSTCDSVGFRMAFLAKKMLLSVSQALQGFPGPQNALYGIKMVTSSFPRKTRSFVLFLFLRKGHSEAQRGCRQTRAAFAGIRKPMRGKQSTTSVISRGPGLGR